MYSCYKNRKEWGVCGSECFVKHKRKPHVFFCLLFPNRATFVLRKSVARFLVLHVDFTGGSSRSRTDLHGFATNFITQRRASMRVSGRKRDTCYKTCYRKTNYFLFFLSVSEYYTSIHLLSTAVAVSGGGVGKKSPPQKRKYYT